MKQKFIAARARKRERKTETEGQRQLKQTTQYVGTQNINKGCWIERERKTDTSEVREKVGACVVLSSDSVVSFFFLLTVDSTVIIAL